ncbi:MAG: ribosome-binding factor A [Chloroflexi bacterium RBG_13_48_17]|nr:MAG: ribosome-binding factor A [Chloroflexi bacterium RBG_13_48_17]
MTRRAERVSSIIQQELSYLLREQVNDPRLASLISITKVTTSSDLRLTKVFISTLENKVDKNEILKGFAAASGFLRKQLANHLKLKHTPELSFHLDDSIERGAEVLKLIEQVASHDTENKDEH